MGAIAERGRRLSNILAGAALLAVSAAAAASILLPAGRGRSAAMLFAIVCFPVLILADQWNSPQISDLRDDPARLAALGLAGIAAVGVLAAAFRRWPAAIPLAIVAALPFRVPLHAGGDSANLLVPLYLVIGGGVLATAAGLGVWRSRRCSMGGRRPPAAPHR